MLKKGPEKGISTLFICLGRRNCTYPLFRGRNNDANMETPENYKRTPSDIAVGYVRSRIENRTKMSLH